MPTLLFRDLVAGWPERSERRELDEVRAVDERGVDPVIVGQRSRSAVARCLEGSVTDPVVRHASCDVLVAR